ncbi:unnamed protein product [Closterium sp. Naga37s-1]|nr:unnamed protein product [Closterium sp. Naga37s-1]
MDTFRGAVDAVAAILRRVLLRDPSNRREACTWLAALIGRVQLPPALRRALVCQLVARSGSLDPGASDRSLLRHLLCEERPNDLLPSPRCSQPQTPPTNPHRILLWFDHFSMGPGSQGGRWGEEGERSREQQRPSAYAATAYAGSGSGSAHTKLAGSAAAGEALQRNSPGLAAASSDWNLLLGPSSVTCSTRELSDAVADGLLRLYVLSKELIG